MGIPRGIYAIINNATGEAYIGRTGSLARRWLAHRDELSRGTHHNGLLQAAWSRDGEQAFALVLLERQEVSGSGQMALAECHWIERARAAGVVLYNDKVGRRRAV